MAWGRFYPNYTQGKQEFMLFETLTAAIHATLPSNLACSAHPRRSSDISYGGIPSHRYSCENSANREIHIVEKFEAL